MLGVDSMGFVKLYSCSFENEVNLLPKRFFLWRLLERSYEANHVYVDMDRFCMETKLL